MKKPVNNSRAQNSRNSENNSQNSAQNSKKSVAIRTLQIFWNELKNYKIRLAILLILTLVATIMYSYIWPLFTSEIINKLTENSATKFTELLPLAAGAILSVGISDIILFRLQLIVHWKLDLEVWKKLSDKVFAKLTAQSMTFHNNKFSGSIVSQTNKFLAAFERLIDTWTWNLFPMIISIFAVFIILTFVGLFPLALILFLMSAGFITYNIIGFRKIAKLNEKLADSENKLSGQLADSMTNMLAVKSFARENFENSRYKNRYETVAKKSTNLLFGVTKLQFIFAILTVVMIAATTLFLIGGREWFGIQIGTLVLAITYTITLTNNMWNFNNVMRQINRAFGDAHEMTKILDEKILVRDISGAKDLQVSRGEIEFCDVVFHHVDAKDGEEIFRDFNLKIPAGQRIGLVGHSGSGKTTLTKLLLRFADVQKGEILIDSQNISEVSQNSLRKNIAYVPQEPLLFHRTIRENIAYGKLDASFEEIRAAAKKANALDFIEKLPEKFDTMTGERGVKLSGGQRQRIAIARAILANSPILILDEATSALDTESEKLIQDALKNLLKNRTAIVIAHRLSTVANLDRIIVLEDGKIAEDDTHQKLISRKNGVYAKLWNRQTGTAREDEESR